MMSRNGKRQGECLTLECQPRAGAGMLDRLPNAAIICTDTLLKRTAVLADIVL